MYPDIGPVIYIFSSVLAEAGWKQQAIDYSFAEEQVFDCAIYLKPHTKSAQWKVHWDGSRCPLALPTPLFSELDPECRAINDLWNFRLCFTGKFTFIILLFINSWLSL